MRKVRIENIWVRKIYRSTTLDNSLSISIRV